MTRPLMGDPRFALAYNGRGCARYGLGKPDEAYLDFEMAETLCPSCAPLILFTEANKEFTLALVARKVDEKLPPQQKPGTTLKARAQTLVIDVPGIWTEGINRPDKWAPVFFGGDQYVRFNIRHEGVADKWPILRGLPGMGRTEEPGITIMIPRNATDEQKSSLLQPVFKAVKAGKHVYVKIDANMGLPKYFTPLQRGEQKWVAGIANLITDYASNQKREITSILNAGSWGTTVALDPNAGPDLSKFNGAVLESPRFGATAVEYIARKYPDLLCLYLLASLTSRMVDGG